MSSNHGFPFQDQVTVDLGKRQIPLKIAGTGNPILFLHGFPLNASMWETTIELLADDFLCLAPNLRGFGNAPEERKSFSLGDLARDCRDLLAAKAVRQPVVVCGLSMGGYVAMQFANDFPDLVSQLVLSNTRANADDEAGVQSRLKMASNALTLGTERAAGEMLQKLVCKFTHENNPNVVTCVRQMLLSTHPSTVAWAQLTMCKRPSFFETMEDWRFPTLCVAGTDDFITPPSVLERMQLEIPGSRYAEIANSAHLTPMEQPEVFASKLRSFITENLH
ncbi:MAG: alpha/beta fold hydrolase [Pirellula sp.]